jgi:crotonobetainyl-CoA:carnitine CoA-transferase CaiB-like acyl-CoA transferase
VASGPLRGIRVLDLSRVIAGPLCTMQLADLGAEVIKVEHPVRGDDSRGMRPPEVGGESHFYLAFNRGKRSVALDIATPEGRDLVEALAARSDVLVENFRPGVMARLGLDHAVLAGRHPRLVYCSISAYGHTSPLAGRAGFDPVLQAESGMMAITGEPGGDPLRHPLAIVDTLTALHATAAILAALHARRETGRGQHIDLALLDCAVAVLGNAAQHYLTSGADPPRMGNAHPAAVPVGLFETKTRPLYLACGTDRLFQALCREVLGRPDMAEDPRFADNAARAAHRDALFAHLEETFASDTCERWLERLEAAGLPAGAVRTVAEALESPEVAARGMLAEVEHPTAGALRLVASPLRLSDTPVVKPAAPPLLGQHTEEVLREVLGLDEPRLAALRQTGVIRDRRPS